MIDFQLETIIYQIGLSQLQKKGDKFHFRCAVCGDSSVSKSKKRAWILKKTGYYHYYCFNCGYSRPLISFLKEFHNHLFIDYFKTTLGTQNKKEIIEVKERVQIELEHFELPTISSLHDEHSAKKYLKSRQIPFKHFENLYYTPNYSQFINDKIPDKLTDKYQSEARIVIPIYNIKKKIIGAQGRSMSKRGIRYITILFNENELNICGLERVKTNETIYITEGYFDSLFLPNAISINSAGVDLNNLLDIARKDRFVFVFDNENRNKQIKNRMIKIAKAGFKICIWPNECRDWGKDINKMISNNKDREMIKTTIDNSIYSGLSAELRIRLK